MEEFFGRLISEYQNFLCVELELSNFMCYQKILSDIFRELKSMYVLEGIFVVYFECRSKFIYNRDVKVQVDEFIVIILLFFNTQREIKGSYIFFMYRYNEFKQKRRNRYENFCFYFRYFKNRLYLFFLFYEFRCCFKRSEF